MKHNKKRNIGIVYELFLRHMSKCIVEDNKKNLKVATDIVSKHFHHKKEIFKEFRVFNTLNNADINSKENAVNILRESKNIIRNINPSKLSKEKSSLIKDINYKINNKHFYYARIEEYKKLGTIQLLINEWKKKENSNFKIEKELEDKVIDILLAESKKVETLNKKDELESSNIVINIMTEKINKKYDGMSLIQKEIIKNYGLYNQKPELLETYLKSVKKSCLEKLNKYKTINENSYLENKFDSVEEKIASINESNCSDKDIVKFLTLTELIEELNTES